MVTRRVEDRSAVIERIMARTRPEPEPVPDPERDAEVAAWRAAALARKADELWAAQVPRRFHAASLDGVQPAAIPHLTAWAATARPRPNMVLAGPVGVGKSWAACAVVREFVRAGESMVFWPLVELLDAIRPNGDPAAFGRACTADLLVLDDVGSERPTDWTFERLYALVNRRWLDELPIIATTNLSSSDLRTAIGERAYSRLVNDGMVIAMSGPDRRKS